MVAVCQFCDHRVDVTDETELRLLQTMRSLWWKAYRVSAEEMFLLKEIRN